MAHLRAYLKYLEKLVKCLPMDDTHFITKLTTQQLLPGDTENKIKTLSTPSDKASYFLSHVIKPALDIDETSDFYELLSIMQNCGYKHVQKLAKTIEHEIDKSDEIKSQPDEIKLLPDKQLHDVKPKVSLQSDRIKSHALDHPDAHIEKFKDEDVVGAFAYLFNKLGILFDEVNFMQLKNACIQRGTLLPTEFKQQIRAAKELDELLDVLDNPMYCNWLNTRLLKRIIKTINIPEAEHLIKAYEECVYSRKVSDVKKHFHSNYFIKSQVSLVEAKISTLFKSLTVADIISYCQEMESDMKVYTGSVTATECQPGCLLITCVIPIHCALHAYEMAKTNFIKFRQSHIQYIEIESYPKIFALKFFTEESNLDTVASEDTSQVISHCYTSLQNYMDADSVSHMMLCENLITDDDYEAITAAPNDYKMNTLLVQYVRSMNAKQLSKFCDILKTVDSHKIIKDCSSFFEAILQKLSTNVKISVSKQLMVSLIQQMKMSEVDMIFYNLINYLYLHLSATEKLPFDMEACSSINPLFTKRWLRKIKSLFLFKIYLLPFITWLDYSILKELAKLSGSQDALKLLNLFDCKFRSYWTQPIGSFPIPPPNQLTIPLDDSEYTLLAMEFCLTSQEDATRSTIVLQDAFDIKLKLKNQWQINNPDVCSFQLVAINTKSRFLYWMIPKHLVKVINDNLFHEWRCGIIKMTVLPANFYTLNNNSEKIKGPFCTLSFFQQGDGKEEKVLHIAQLHHEITEMSSHMNILEIETAKLKEDHKKLSELLENRGTEDQASTMEIKTEDLTQLSSEIIELTSHVEMLKKENEVLKEDKIKLAKHFGEKNAKKKEPKFSDNDAENDGKTHQKDLTQLSSEIIELTSRVEILKKENEVLKEDKKKLAKHFGEKNAKKKEPKFSDNDAENDGKTHQSRSTELHIHQLMNIVPLIQEKWSLIGIKLKLSLDKLDEIYHTASKQQIPVESKNTFCCIKMLTSWYVTSDDVSVDAIMMAIDAPHVGLKTKISSIEAALISDYTTTDSSEGKSVTNPPEKLEQQYVDMTTKFCLELNKSQCSIFDIVTYLKMCNVNPNVLDEVSDFPMLLKSFQKYGLLNKADLSWLKNIAHHAECTQATEVIEEYESMLMADKIPWYSSHPTGSYLVGRTNKMPENVTIKDSNNAKSVASKFVDIEELDIVLQSAEVGSVTFYWKLVNNNKAIQIPIVTNTSLIRKCRDAGLTHVGVMIDGNLNWTEIGGKFLLSKTRFTSVKQIPRHLLESVSMCYSEKVKACKWCFLTHLPSTREQLQLMLIPDKDTCRKCLQKNGAITVIPASDLCEDSCYGNFVAIHPAPFHKSNINVFHYCTKYKELFKHKQCLLLNLRENPWYPHSVEEIVIWTVEYNQGVLFDNVYKQYCRAALPLTSSCLVSPSVADATSDSPQRNKQLYCGYCNIQCNTSADLAAHCTRDRHKFAVFADSGRDVFWEFEPPPPLKKEEISQTAVHGIDKVKEWKVRLEKRAACARNVKKLQFGLNDPSVKHGLTDNICGLETELQCSCTIKNASCFLAAESSEKVIWTLTITGNSKQLLHNVLICGGYLTEFGRPILNDTLRKQHHSFRGVRLKEDTVFKLARVLHCSTNKDFKIEHNMFCTPDNKPGLLLGLVKVIFNAMPKTSNKYKNQILVDVGLSKCLSIPVALKVVSSKLYNLLNLCPQPEMLLLEIKSVFSSSELEIKEMSSTLDDLEDKRLIKMYSERMKQADLYSDNCATILESTDKIVFYEKLQMLLCLEGDYRSQLLQRVSKQKILAKLTCIRGPPSLEIKLKDLGDEVFTESLLLLINSSSILVQFHSSSMCPAVTSYMWECSQVIAEDVLLIQLPPSFPMLPKLDQNGEHFSIAFEFSVDFTYLAKCHAAIEDFKNCKLDYLLFPSDQTLHPNTKSFTCKSPLRKWNTELNPQQVLAMEAILLSESVLPVIIAGPFGTGKTFLLAQAAEYLVNHSKHCHILICTLTNSAANVYLEHFHKRIPSDHDYKILRLVYKRRIVTTIPIHLYKYCVFESSNQQRFCYPSESDARKYHIIVTNVGMVQELLKLNMTGHFTHIFIDEAAQMTIPEAMMALSLASNTTKVVLAGDHMQMNPEIYSPLTKEYNLDKSPLQCIYGEYSELPHGKHKILLTCNYRTHGEILKLPSKFFYRNKLKSCSNINKHMHPDYKPLMLLKSDDNKESYSPVFNSYFNQKEADEIMRFLKELLSKWPEAEWGQIKNDHHDIGVLTTEYAQVRYIRTLLKKEQISNVFVNTVSSAQGQEFQVVILSVVRTHHSINKDSAHQCGFYADKRVLNTAFTRVQSLIVTAAHPLSLITTGHMTCRLFWASYLSESLSDEEIDQLRKKYVSKCQDDKLDRNQQLNLEECKIDSVLKREHISLSDSEECCDQILDDLEKQYDVEEAKFISVMQPVNNISLNESHSLATSCLITSPIYVGATTSNNVEFTLSNTSYSNPASSTNAKYKAGTISCKTIFLLGLHKPYSIEFSPKHSTQLNTVSITKGAESGYALVIDPAVKDIWLPDSSALNRSLRGDTVVIEKQTEKKGTVISNLSDHPKHYFVCYCDRRIKNLFVPIDRQYPKIDTIRNVIEDNGLRIYYHYTDGLRNNNNYYKIQYQDIEKNVYLVWLNKAWKENFVYPKGVLVDFLPSLRDSSMSRAGNELLSRYINILKYNYIPAMISDINDGNNHYEAEAQGFPENWKIPVNERENRKFYGNVFTIDDEETVVLDDALSLDEDKKNNNYIVNVHIADGSYFVKPGSALDRAALERGRTFYINYEDDRAMFMLPDNICMKHGSLQVGKERLAVTARFVFSKNSLNNDSELSVSDVEVHRSIVCSTCRLTKEDAGRFLLDKSMTQLKGMNSSLFSKIRRDLSILGQITTKLRKSWWPDSYLYEPDRGKQDKYSLAGSSLVEVFMCLCNTAIPAELLRRDGQVGPVLVQTPIKHHKQHEWLENHYRLLECCPLLKRMISTEVLEPFSRDHQIVRNDEMLTNIPCNNEVLTINKESWDEICGLADRSENSLSTYLCSLHNFPELFVAYRQLCKSRSKSFYDIISSEPQSLIYKHSQFDKIYTHFTSPLRRYCDILVHRAILGETSLPGTEQKVRELLHKMNIHKWDEREFTHQRNMLCLVDCCKKGGHDITVTVYVGKITNKLMELHAPPELQDFLLDKICEIKLSHLQAEGDSNNKHLMTWHVEMIPAELEKEIANKKLKYFNVVEIQLEMLAKIIQVIHDKNVEEAKELIKSHKTKDLKQKDFEQAKIEHSRQLIITKYIREYSKLDVQLSSTQEKSYAIEPTISMVHISQTFSCCLLHVKHPIECYDPNILKFSAVNLATTRRISHYADLWWPAITAESITNSIKSKRIPVIVKDLQLTWTSNTEAQFTVTNFEEYKIKFQNPFSVDDYVCIQYRNLLLNPSSKYFELDSNKKATWVAHGKIVKEDQEQIIIEFNKNTIPPKMLFFEATTTPCYCDLEVIPLQITFRRIYKMFKRMRKKNKREHEKSFIEKICCRSYSNPIMDPPIIYNNEDDRTLNKGQREVVEKALIDGNKLLLIQGPPGTGKSKTCVELIKRFVNLNQKEISHDQPQGPPVLYCAPSNKAVNVGARAALERYPELHVLRICGTKIEDIDFCGLGDMIPMLAKRKISFEKDEDTSKIPEKLQKHSLHFKIRDASSMAVDVKKFIAYEKYLSENANELQLLEDYKKFKEISDKYIALKKSAENVVIKGAQVIFCTCAEAGSSRMNTRVVKQCIIDECAMCIEPETLLPMTLSEKIILVGDHMQLQPVVLSKIAENLGLKISMFQRLFEDERMFRYRFILTQQYRMHPSICGFPSGQFYDGRLVAAKEVLKRRWPGRLPSDIWKQPQTQRCVFIHVEGTEDVSGIDAEGSYTESISNKMEAKKVKFVIDNLVKELTNYNDIMVLTPYRAQINCCMKEVKHPIEITTIHGSQGRECNIVILTTVRSLPEEDIPDHPSHLWVNENMGFVTDEHLMNVAITRAKEALCIIGNKKLLEKHRMWKSLLDHYREHDCVI